MRDSGKVYSDTKLREDFGLLNPYGMICTSKSISEYR